MVHDVDDGTRWISSELPEQLFMLLCILESMESSDILQVVFD